ncbi:MAG: VOC family protein [Candidatus Firestonebacteria bacterium]
MSEAKFEHIGLTVRDIEKAIGWYKDNFGIEEIKRFDKPDLELKGAVIKLGDFLIEFLQPYTTSMENQKSNTKNQICEILHEIKLVHFSLSVADINSTYRKLKENNIEFITEIFDSRYFFCKDPDGFLIEVKQGKQGELHCEI